MPRKIPARFLEIPQSTVKLCNRCRHLYRMTGCCRAYPDGIPEEILAGEVDHTQPHAGDHGYQFEPDPESDAEFKRLMDQLR